MIRRKFNKLIGSLRRESNFYVSPPLSLTTTSGFQAISLEDGSSSPLASIHATITASNGNAYDWQSDTQAGTLASNTQAIEINGRCGLAPGTPIVIYPFNVNGQILNLFSHVRTASISQYAPDLAFGADAASLAANGLSGQGVYMDNAIFDSTQTIGGYAGVKGQSAAGVAVHPYHLQLQVKPINITHWGNREWLPSSPLTLDAYWGYLSNDRFFSSASFPFPSTDNPLAWGHGWIGATWPAGYGWYAQTDTIINGTDYGGRLFIYADAANWTCVLSSYYWGESGNQTIQPDGFTNMIWPMSASWTVQVKNQAPSQPGWSPGSWWSCGGWLMEITIAQAFYY